jgi:hypothetical protein
MKSELSIRRELRRVEKAKKNASQHTDFHALFGAEQALAWALGRNAMAPARCFAQVKGR